MVRKTSHLNMWSVKFWIQEKYVEKRFRVFFLFLVAAGV